MKKNISVLFLILMFIEAPLWARFTAADDDRESRGWSWSGFAFQMKTTIASFFGEKRSGGIALFKNQEGHETSGEAEGAGTNSVTPQSMGSSNLVTSEKRPSHTPSFNMSNATPKIRSLDLVRIAKRGQPFKDKNLKLGNENVPVFDFKRLKTVSKHVPLLNIGVEPTIDGQEFALVDVGAYSTATITKLETRPEPPIVSVAEFNEMLGPKVLPAKDMEKIEIPILYPENKVTAEKVMQINYTAKTEVAVTVEPVVHMDVEDLKLLRGLILVGKRDQCHQAAGIFSDLSDSKKEGLSIQSHYQLGLCLHDMNLPSEAIYHLSKVLKSNLKEYHSESIKALFEEVQPRHESLLIELISSIDIKEIPEDVRSTVTYYRAKYFIRKGDGKKALDLAEKIPMTSTHYQKSQYLASVAEYILGRQDAAIARQKQLITELMKKGGDKELLALVQLNLGRVAFQKSKYKESLEAFQKVPREHPLWMQALTELAWVQLQSKDMAGAIGNMHSIQSPYFETVYKPESYIARAIGYLSICQYADAYKSLGYFEHKYTPWLTQMNAYNESHTPSQSYQSVVKYLDKKARVDADGLPFQVLLDAARQKDFLNAQENINQLIDENGGYEFVKGLIEKDRKALIARRSATIARIIQLRQKISKARSTPGAMKDFNAWRFELGALEEFLAMFDFKNETLKESLAGFQRLIPKAQGRIAGQKEEYRAEAGKVIKSHFVRMAKNLKRNLDNNELLKFEIYAGSGDNLRYQVVGEKHVGAVKGSSFDRKPSGMNWDFEGEFWEDEIGNYRSSLKNNCQETVTQAKKE